MAVSVFPPFRGLLIMGSLGGTGTMDGYGRTPAECRHCICQSRSRPCCFCGSKYTEVDEDENALFE